MDYYEQPTFERIKRHPDESDDTGYSDNHGGRRGGESEDLDIPTFLRRKVK